MNKLNTFYSSLLKSIGYEISNGYVKILDKSQQVVVEGKTLDLVLPTDDMLKDGDWVNCTAFHPACESIFKGQSEVVNMLSNRISIHLHTATLQMAVVLLRLAADTTKHKGLTLKQMELISSIPSVTPSAINYLQKIINKGTGIKGERALMALQLSREGTINDVVFDRVCKLIVPILDTTDPIYDIQASIKSQKAVRAVLEIIFPTARACGSNSKDTPYLDSLLHMYVTTATHLNGLRKVLGKYKSGTSVLTYEWMDDLSDLKTMAAELVPQPFPGNTGTGYKDIEVPDIVEPVVHETKIVTPTVIIPTVVEPTAPSNNGIRSTTVKPQVIEPRQQPVYQPQPAVQQPVYQPQPVMQQPVYPQHQVQQPVYQPVVQQPQGVLTPEQLMNQANANNIHQHQQYAHAQYRPMVQNRPVTRSDLY